MNPNDRDVRMKQAVPAELVVEPVWRTIKVSGLCARLTTMIVRERICERHRAR